MGELELDPQTPASLGCWVLPALLPFRQGGGSASAGCQGPGKHIFSLCPHRGSKMAQQPEKSPCQRVGPLQDVSGVDCWGGVREGALGGLAAADWPEQLSVPQEEVHSPASNGKLRTCKPWRSLCWPQREEAGLCWGESVVSDIEERAPSWGSGLLSSSPPNSCSVVSMTKQGGWISCCLRPKIYQTGRVNLAEGPAPRLTTQQPPAWS